MHVSNRLDQLDPYYKSHLIEAYELTIELSDTKLLTDNQKNRINQKIENKRILLGMTRVEFSEYLHQVAEIQLTTKRQLVEIALNIPTGPNETTHENSTEQKVEYSKELKQKLNESSRFRVCVNKDCGHRDILKKNSTFKTIKTCSRCGNHTLFVIDFKT